MTPVVFNRQQITDNRFQMAFEIQIPFFAFKLHFHGGNTLLSPLSDKSVLRVGQPITTLAAKYANLLQQKVLNQGSLQELLNEVQDGNFLHSEIQVQFPESGDLVSHPAFALSFIYYFNEKEEGIWGIVPSLGIESFAPDLPTLEKRLINAIKLDFARKNRFLAIQQIVSAIWIEQVELNRQEMTLKAPTPKELDSLDEGQEERLLPKVAKLLNANMPRAYGRNEEVLQIARFMKSQFQRNVLLVGASGTGKTALVWEIARKKKQLKINGAIYETTASTLIKELTQNTGWQDNLAVLCKELTSSEDFLFITNLRTLFEVGKYEGNQVSIAEYLQTYLSRGEINIISECSAEELASIELLSPNFLNHFQVIRLEEPKIGLEIIIEKKVKDIAAKRKVNIQLEAIQEIIRLNKRFAPYSGLPGRPIRFLESIILNKKSFGKGLTIDRAEIIEHFCNESGMPSFMVDPEIQMDIQATKNDFNTKVYGQEEAVNGLVDLLGAVKTALTRSGKPIASFLFVGPTGVGKTELAKVLAEYMFGSKDRLLRFDMSEFSSPYAVMRLTGLDYFSDGLLTSAVRREPFSVLLFDEIEKAHPNFYDLLLQLLSEGRLTDSQGKLVNFCSTIIILTSNIGAKRIQEQRIGWVKKEDFNSIKDQFMTAVQKYFRPELYNRIDQVISFMPLGRETVRLVVNREMKKVFNREGIKFRRLNLKIEDHALDYIAEVGYNPKYGARQLQRTIRQQILIPLSYELNEQDHDDQLDIIVDYKNGQLEFNVMSDPLGLDLLLEELDQINQANYSSYLRRKIYRLQEGHFFVRLLSEVDILEREKREDETKFWKNTRKTEQYAYYLETKSKVLVLTEEIETLETSLTLTCLDQLPFTPNVNEIIEQWEEQYFNLRVEIYSRLHPEVNNTHLGIYGNNINPVFDFYRSVLDNKSFEYTVYSVWFRESYYNEEIVVDESKKKRKEYIKLPINLNAEEPFKAEEQQDVLLGIEFAVGGTCAYLYLQNEGAYQQWVDGDDTFTYYCEVDKELFQTPTPIHRREFYQRQSPRRIIDDSHFKDSVYKINREYNRSDLVDFFQEYLDQNFRRLLDRELD